MGFLRQSLLLNAPALLLYLCVFPCLLILHNFLRIPLFCSLLLWLCVHGRAPPCVWIATAYADRIADAWPMLSISAASTDSTTEDAPEDEAQGVCFVLHTRGLCRKLIAWALLLQLPDARRLPLLVSMRLPPFCNAPGIRIAFQLAGFLDFRQASVNKAIQGGKRHMLCFDETEARTRAQLAGMRVLTCEVRCEASKGERREEETQEAKQA